MQGKLYSAIDSFYYRNTFVPAGALVREGHEILEGREELFRPAQVLFEVDEAPKKTARPSHSSKSEDNKE